MRFLGIVIAMVLRCVIVDDSLAVLRSATQLLERQGIHIVGRAASGDDAVRVIEEVEPDVVLVDIDLGPESGFDVTRRLVESRRTARSHTILISTYDESDFADLIAASPAVGFLSKSDLSATEIHRLLEGHGRDEL